jgi:poly-beta-1,6-N-acetyl-D-glucosamine biosynthesis protein PgaD
MYLWMPLITLFAWWVGAKLFHTHFIKFEGASGLFDKLGLYALIIFLLSATLIMWAYIEQLRFKGKHRRKVGSAVTVEQVAHKYQINEHKLARIRHKKVLEVHFSNQGDIAKIVEI